jgi:hypothetical protein
VEYDSKFVRSSCNDEASDKEFMVLNIFVSSAKVAIFDFQRS